MSLTKHWLSIVMPTYNSEETISVALESILNQSFKEIEVLVVDGFSTDQTLEIARTYQNLFDGIKIFSEKDKGIYDAMNKGITLAKGEYLYFMGTDDVFHESTTLKKVISVLSKTQVNVVYGNVKIIGNTGWAKHHDVYDGAFGLSKLIQTNICHQAIFYKTHFIKNKIGNFNLKYKICSDWDLNLRCWAKQPFEYMDLIVADFNAEGFSSNSYDIEFENDFISNLMIYFKWNLNNPYLNSKKFKYYKKVIELKKENYPLRFFITNTIKSYIERMIKKYGF